MNPLLKTIVKCVVCTGLLVLGASVARCGDQAEVRHTRELLCTAADNVSMYLVRRYVEGRTLSGSVCIQSPFVESESLEIVRSDGVRRTHINYLRRTPILTFRGDTVFVLQVQFTSIEIVKNSAGETVGYFVILSTGHDGRSSYCASGYLVLDQNLTELYAWVGVEARPGLDGRTFIERGKPEAYYSQTLIEGGYVLERRKDLHNIQCWIRP